MTLPKSGPRRSSELQDELGISPTTLSYRLVNFVRRVFSIQSHTTRLRCESSIVRPREVALRPEMEAVADWIDENEA